MPSLERRPAMAAQQQPQNPDDQGEQDRGLVEKIGPIEVDWPRTIG